MKMHEPSNTDTSLSMEIDLTRDQGVKVADAAGSISRIALEVADGSESQTRLLDTAVGTSNEMSASMGETTRKLESIATFVEEIVSSVNESAASIEQVSGNSTALQAFQIAASAEETARSIDSVTSTTQSMAVSADELPARLPKLRHR
jgi:methyl-accepting chemotaxis protein